MKIPIFSPWFEQWAANKTQGCALNNKDGRWSLLQPQKKLEPSREAWGWSKTSTVQTRCQTGLIPVFPHFQQIGHWAENGFGALNLLCDRTSQPGDGPGPGSMSLLLGASPQSISVLSGRPSPPRLSPRCRQDEADQKPSSLPCCTPQGQSTESKQSCDTTHHVCAARRGCKRLQGQVCSRDES